jgi:hypothetical protein
MWVPLVKPKFDLCSWIVEMGCRGEMVTFLLGNKPSIMTGNPKVVLKEHILLKSVTTASLRITHGQFIDLVESDRK